LPIQIRAGYNCVVPVITRKTITATFLDRVQTTPDAVGFQFKPTHAEMGPVGTWHSVTFKEFYQVCRQVAYGLMSLGIEKGDRVAILSNTRFEWSLSDMAILGSGAVTVPIYASNTATDVAFIINHSGAKVVFVEDGKQLAKVLEKRLESPDALPTLEKIICLEPSAMITAAQHAKGLDDTLTLQALRELGRREEGKDPARFDDLLREAKPDDILTICYTSGTTGVPKGAMLTHDNVMSVLEDCVTTLIEYLTPDREVVLSFLPFSHVIGKLESMAVYVFGWRQNFAENLDTLMANLAEIRPTIVFAVPRIFEKAHNRVLAMVESGPSSKKKLFDWATVTGRRYFEALWSKRSPGLKDTLEYKAAKKLVLSKIAHRFGGRLRFAVCGGAPLPKEIGEFFEIAGIKILEGYGLTETSAPVSLNSPGDTRFGTVGRPLPEVNLKIADDGEILVKSRKVFKGYYKMEKETAEVFTDGWFHTGDIGHIDQDGFIHITDRKKDIIVTSGGKNVAPQKIENIAKTQKIISQFVVHGDRRHYLTALVTLDRDQVIQYANAHSILFSEYGELIKNPKIIALVQKTVDEINGPLASFETVKKFAILPNEFTVESGELTPSMKVRRSYVNKKFQRELDTMYA